MPFILKTKQGQKGPFSTQTILKLVKQGKLQPEHKIFDSNTGEGVYVSSLLESDNNKGMDSDIVETVDEVVAPEVERSANKTRRTRNRRSTSVNQAKGGRSSRGVNRNNEESGKSRSRERSSRGRSGDRQQKGNDSVFKTVGGIVLVLCLLFGIKMCNKSSSNADVKSEVMALVRDNVASYRGNESYYQNLINRFHDQAFDAAYSMGGRRSGSKFDGIKYENTLLSLMAKQALADNKQEIAAELTMILNLE